MAAIRAVVKSLPVRPGVYRMLDARGDVLYVGKARALKNRVTQYTQVARQTKRLLRMISQTRSMQIVTTHSEAEALLLEAQLIKRYRPPYNVLLRDDKSFPFILLREDHDFPRVQLHRGARRHKGQYYGPFASAGSVRNTLNSLQKLFLLRSCTDSFFANRTRPCLLYQIRRCSAPCVGRVDEAGYARAGPRRQGLPRRPIDQDPAEAAGADERGVGGDEFRAGRGLSRPAAGAHLRPGQPGDPCREARRRRSVRARLQGRDDVHPGLLHPRRPELGASQLLPGPYQRRAGGRGAAKLPRPILRGGAAAAPDPDRPRRCPRPTCSARPFPRRPSARWR